MIHIRLLTTTVFCFIISLAGMKAQEAIPATGGNASGSGGSVSYSLGQVVYHMHTGTNFSMAEGVQQPYEISVVTTIEDGVDALPGISVYPNPTNNHLSLRMEELEIKGLSYQLYDMTGKLLEGEKITSSQSRINMENIAPGTYILKVIHKGKQLKTFKVIKSY